MERFKSPKEIIHKIKDASTPLDGVFYKYAPRVALGVATGAIAGGIICTVLFSESVYSINNAGNDRGMYSPDSNIDTWISRNPIPFIVAGVALGSIGGIAYSLLNSKQPE